MAQVNLPSTLSAAQWEKQKAVIDKATKSPASKLGDELKALAKLHLGVDWAALAGGKGSADEARAALDDAVKGRIKALADQARAVAEAASKFEADVRKDKKVPKEPLAAVAAIAKAARDYGASVDEAVAELRKTLDARVQAAAKAASKAPAAPAGDDKTLKLVRGRALDALRAIRKPAPGAKPVRFVVVQGKASVATYLGPSAGTSQEALLKELLADEAPFKSFKDPSGEVVWEQKALTFVSDVLPSGIVKKLQLWLKATLKMNLKVRVRRTDGSVEESEGGGGDDLDALLAAEPAAPVDPAANRALAMEQWKAERAAAIEALRKVAADVAAAKHPASAKAVVELQAVIKNLTPEPATLQQVASLQTWLANDDVVRDVCELAEDVSAPLLAALDELQSALTA